MTRPLGDELLGLLADTTSAFISCPVSEIGVAVDHALAAVGRMFNVDRAYLFTFLDGHTFVTNTHEWCAPEVEPAIDDLQAMPVDVLPWWMGELYAGRCINLTSLDDLPDCAEGERAVLQPQGIQSLLVVPIFWDHRLEGFAGFDHVRSHRIWSAEEIGSCASSSTPSPRPSNGAAARNSSVTCTAWPTTTRSLRSRTASCSGNGSSTR
ncbi:MAG: GAF domain-containing protein [Acidimicrobiales bacterium]